MTNESLEPSVNPSEEIEQLEKAILELEELVKNPEQHGIFDALGKEGLQKKLNQKREELAVKILENL